MSDAGFVFLASVWLALPLFGIGAFLSIGAKEGSEREVTGVAFAAACYVVVSLGAVYAVGLYVLEHMRVEWV